MPAPGALARRLAFDEAADAYDATRPGYPDALVADVVGLASLPADPLVLEVGCGTGQATLPFARRGHRVVCVEIGERLAALARRNLAAHPGVRVVTAEFESWVPDAGPFDLVLAATSWRWLDPDVRLARAAALLRPGGALAVCASTHAMPAGETDPFFAGIQEVYAELGQAHAAWPPPPPERVPGHAHEIAASGWFGPVTQRRYVWAVDYTADRYLALLDTFPDHRAMAPDVRRRLDAEIRRRLRGRRGGTVRRHWVTVLDVARLLPYVG